MRKTRHLIEGAQIFRGAALGPEGPRTALCACGNGSVPSDLLPFLPEGALRKEILELLDKIR